jgi:hypothetical protein
MEEVMKRGQFFLIALLLLALAMFVMFSFFRTTDTAAVTMFKKSSFIDIKNIQNAISDKNTWLNESDWWNASWAYRIEVRNTDAQTPAEINISIPAGHISDCDKEIRVVNASGLVESNVSSVAPPCNITFNTCAGCDYFIYYGNPDAVAPTRTVANSGTLIYPTIITEGVGDLCEHFEYIYPIQGIDIECDVINSYNNGQKANYSINFTSTDLQFKGYIG